LQGLVVRLNWCEFHFALESREFLKAESHIVATNYAGKISDLTDVEIPAPLLGEIIFVGGGNFCSLCEG